MSGYTLAAKIIAKHLGNFGNTISETLAGFDPVTATEVDRDNLRAQLREIATRLAEAKRKHGVEQKQVTDLTALIATDEKASEVLIAKFEKGEIDEATLNEFASNLDSQKARLPGEQADAANTKELMDMLQGMLDAIEAKLNDFDRNAKDALGRIERAKADAERQNLRLQNQAELQALQSGVGSPSTALGALGKQAAKLEIEAEAAKTLANIGQKPLDRANAVDEARRIAAGTAPAASESAVARMRRIAAAGN